MKKIISLTIGAIMLFSVEGIGTAFTSEIPSFDNNSAINVQEEKNDNKSNLSDEKEEIISSSEIEKKEEETQKTAMEDNDQVKEYENQTSSVVETMKQDNISNNFVETQIESEKKDNPWTSLGITEYEFYNNPAHSWAELDFRLSAYGSKEATLNACKEYGDKYISENGGGYFCDSVNSYSGDYLGEDIDFY